MAPMESRFHKLMPVLKYSVVGLIIGLALIRFINLDVDPPTFYYGYSQSDLTDPYQYTFHARSAVLFGEWTPFEFHRWDVFKNSLISGTAYILFSLFGVSRITANLAAVILNLGGFLFFALGLAQWRSRRETVITILLGLFGNVLLFYGRLPFLENGLIFLSGLTFYLFMKFHDRMWGQLLTGFLVALSAMVGKLFGFLLLVPILLTLIYRFRSKSSIPWAVTIAGTILGTFICVLIFYGGNVGIAMHYYGEQTVGMYGLPDAFFSPLKFFQRMIGFGAEMGLFELAIFPGILVYMGLIIIMLTLPLERPFRKEILPLVFIVVWLLSGFLGLMPFNYRPLRYTLPLFLPMAAVAGYAINYLIERKNERAGLHIRWLSLLIIFFASWYIITQVYALFVPYMKEVQWAEEIIPVTLAPAAVIAVLFHLWFRRERPFPFRVGLIVFSAILIGLFVEQGSYIYRGVFRTGKFLKTYNRELSEILDKKAVVTGPYAPALTIDGRLKGIIYVFGLAQPERDLFSRYPISHLLTDQGNWEAALRDFPGLKGSSLISRMKVRDIDIDIYRLPGCRIPMTDFELAGTWAVNGQIDSAQACAERFVRAYPDNLSGLRGLSYCYGVRKDADQLLKMIELVRQKYPRDFRASQFCRDGYFELYKMTHNESYKTMSGESNREALALNPALRVRTH